VGPASRKYLPKLEAILVQKSKDTEQDGDEEHEAPRLKEWVPLSPTLLARHLCPLHSSQLAGSSSASPSAPMGCRHAKNHHKPRLPLPRWSLGDAIRPGRFQPPRTKISVFISWKASLLVQAEDTSRANAVASTFHCWLKAFRD